jgi:hypothetical protein
MGIECFGCERPIPHGQPFVSVTYSIERTTPAGYIEVERAEALLNLCADCAPSEAAIADALRSAGLPVPHGAGQA